MTGRTFCAMDLYFFFMTASVGYVESSVVTEDMGVVGEEVIIGMNAIKASFRTWN
jgi:hypothetical protein